MRITALIKREASHAADPSTHQHTRNSSRRGYPWAAHILLLCRSRGMPSRLQLPLALLLCPRAVGQVLFTFSYSGGTAHGYEGASVTGAPVYLFNTGGGMGIGPSVPEYDIIREAAARGFVAAMITPPNPAMECSQLEAAASATYGSASNSALSVLCARASADCNRGVAVHGFSMGGLISALAPKFSSLVTASIASGAGSFTPGHDSCCGLADTSCCASKTDNVGVIGGTQMTCLSDQQLSTYLPRSRRRVIIGATDLYCACPSLHTPNL